MKVVTRIGVGYDAVDVPALSRRGIPLLVVGIANSPVGRRTGAVHDADAGQTRRRVATRWSRTANGPPGSENCRTISTARRS